MSARPDGALSALAEELRDGGTVISPHVQPSQEQPVLGLLAAAGPRAASDPPGYAFVIEAIREGYLLHYGAGRVVQAPDSDLALLAGDYLYALGLSRLAALGDLPAIGELADLISIAAALHPDGAAPARRDAEALWLAVVVAVAAGPDPDYEEGKRGLIEGGETARRQLWRFAERGAGGKMQGALERAVESVGFARDELIDG